jgi:Queuine tRNA-ribosyltransferase
MDAHGNGKYDEYDDTRNMYSSHGDPFAGKCGALLQRVVQRTNGWSHCIRRHCAAVAAQQRSRTLMEFWTPIHLAASRLPLDSLLSCPTLHHKSELTPQTIASDCCNVVIVGWDAVSYSRERKRQALHDLMISMQSLPSPPRQYTVLSVDNLQSILDVVKEGVSIIGTDIVRHWSCSGKALCLDLTLYYDDGLQDVPVDKSIGGLIDLRDERYAHDARVLIPGCRFIVGPSFSRAYIHHLIKANEMLAETLLFIHNLNQMLLLMRQLSIAAASLDSQEDGGIHEGMNKNLETYCNWIEEQL